MHGQANMCANYTHSKIRRWELQTEGTIVWLRAVSPWYRSHIKEPVAAQIVKKSPVFYWTRRLIILITSPSTSSCPESDFLLPPYLLYDAFWYYSPIYLSVFLTVLPCNSSKPAACLYNSVPLIIYPGMVWRLRHAMVTGDLLNMESRMIFSNP